MLEKEKAIDAILCATPDHAHAVVAVTAMKAGQARLLREAVDHNVWEARLVARVAKETGVATQMGNHGHSGEGIRQTCEWIWDGAIGPVREVHAWSDTGELGQDPRPAPRDAAGAGRAQLGPVARAPQHAPVQSNLRPVELARMLGFRHRFDRRHLLSQLGPRRLGARPERAPQRRSVGGRRARFRRGARGRPVHLSFRPARRHARRHAHLVRRRTDARRPRGHRGGRPAWSRRQRHPVRRRQGDHHLPGWAGTPRLFPGSKDAAYQRPAKTLPRSNGHHLDWLAACKGGKPASAHFEYSAGLTEFVLLGHVALRMQKKVYWDAAAMKFTNAPEADAILKETSRSGWEVA